MTVCRDEFETEQDLIDWLGDLGYEVSDFDCRVFVPFGQDGKVVKTEEIVRVL